MENGREKGEGIGGGGVMGDQKGVRRMRAKGEATQREGTQRVGAERMGAQRMGVKRRGPSGWGPADGGPADGCPADGRRVDEGPADGGTAAGGRGDGVREAVGAVGCGNTYGALASTDTWVHDSRSSFIRIGPAWCTARV